MNVEKIVIRVTTLFSVVLLVPNITIRSSDALVTGQAVRSTVGLCFDFKYFVKKPATKTKIKQFNRSHTLHDTLLLGKQSENVQVTFVQCWHL